MNINTPSQTYNSPLLDQKNPASLFHACQSNDLRAVQAWVGEELELNPRTNRGETPLSIACGKGYTEIVKTLIEANADLCFQLRSDTPRTPLREAVQNVHIEVFKLLVNESVKQNLQDVLNVQEKDDKTTLLFLACLHNDLEIVKILLKNLANANLKNNNGETSLHVASMCSDLKIAKELLKKGANPNLQINACANKGWAPFRGWTPLHFACDKGDVELAELLISHKGDLYLQNEQGKTPLDLALPDMIPLLLEKQRQSN